MKHCLALSAIVAMLALPATAAVHSVSIQGFAFSPASVDIDVGDTVEWTNNDLALHTVTEDVGAFDSGTMSPNDVFSFTFASAGDFGYFCGFHPSMTGNVSVGGGTCDLEVALSGAPSSIARGSTLSFTATASNPCDGTLTLNEAVMVVTGPASVAQSLYDGASAPVRAGRSVSAPVSLGVPGIAPLGTYTVTVTIYRGTHEEINSDSFDITVTQ